MGTKDILCLKGKHPHKYLKCFKSIHFIFTLLVNSLSTPKCLHAGKPPWFYATGSLCFRYKLTPKEWVINPMMESSFRQKKKFRVLTSKYLGTASPLTQDEICSSARTHYCEELTCASQQVITFSIENNTKYQEARPSSGKQPFFKFPTVRNRVIESTQNDLGWKGP